MSDSVSRRSALRLVGGAITVAAAATAGVAVPTYAAGGGRPGGGGGARRGAGLGPLSRAEHYNPQPRPP
ncbi:hypothetical protein ABZ369_38020, partial [Streptomyces sp. NPDC005918]